MLFARTSRITRSVFQQALIFGVAASLLPSALAQECGCTSEVTIETHGDIPDFKVAGAEKGPAQKIVVQIEPETEYEFTLSNTTDNGCETGEVTFGCGLEYQVMDPDTGPSGWVQGGSFEAKVRNSILHPTSFRLRRPKSTTEDQGDTGPPSSGSPPGGANLPSLPMPPSLGDSIDGTVSILPANVSISIPLGQVALGSGGGAPYVSAGVLSWGGPVAPALAKPNLAKYLGSEDVKGRPAGSVWGPAAVAKVTYAANPAFPNEMHVLTPTRLFRVTGFNQDPAVNMAFSTAPNTFVREYVRGSSSESASVTLATGNSPVSWWKISAISYGVKVEQMVQGVQRYETYVSQNSTELKVNDGILETYTLLVPPVSVGQTYNLQTIVSRIGTMISKKIETYEKYQDSYQIKYQTEFPDLASGTGQTIEYHYYPSSAPSAAAGNVWWVSYPDQSWEVYTYQPNGDSARFSPFGSESILDPSQTDPSVFPVTPAPGFSPATAHVRKYVTEYAQPQEEYIGTIADVSSSNTLILIRRAPQSDEFSASNDAADAIPDDIPLVSTGSTISYSPDIATNSPYRWLAGRLILGFDATGKAEYYQYSQSGSTLVVTMTTGVEALVSTNPTVSDRRFSVVNNLSEQTISTYDGQKLVSREFLYHTGSVFTRGRLETLVYQGDVYEHTEVSGIETHRIDRPDPLTIAEKNEQGQVLTRCFNPQGELLWTETAAGAGVPALRETTEIQGLTRTTKKNGVVIGVTVVDGMGRTVSSTDETGAVTTYSFPNGGKDEKTILPGGIVRLEEFNFDRTRKSKSGTGWVAEFNSLGVNSTGDYETHSSGSSSSHTERAITKYFNLSGLPLKVIRPSGTGTGKFVEEVFQYGGDDSSAQVIGEQLSAISFREIGSSGNEIKAFKKRRFLKTISDASKPTVVMGGEEWQGLDLNNDGSLDLGVDRVTKRIKTYVLVDGVVYRRNQSYVYPSTAGTNPLVTETLDSVGFINDGLTYKVVNKVIQPSGRFSTTTAVFSPSIATAVTTEDDSGTAATDDIVTTQVNGYIVSVKRATDDKAQTYAYDERGRIKSTSNARNSLAIGYYLNDREITSTVDQFGHQTSYSYYQPGEANAGKIKKIIQPGGEAMERTYNDRGQIVRTSGSGVYTQELGYDDFGDQVTLHTYGTQEAITKWIRQPGTGMVSSRLFNSAAPGYSYEYTPEGKLAKRTSPRGVVATYSYDDATRDLTGVSYSGESGLTPDLTFSEFDGIGRPASVSEYRTAAVDPGATGSSNFYTKETLSYQPYSGATTVSYPADHPWLGGVTVQKRGDDLGRFGGIDLKIGSSIISSQIYQYNTSSYVDKVSASASTNDLNASLSYLNGSGQVRNVSVSLSGGVIYTRDQSIDMLERIIGVVNKAGASAGSLATVASVGHQYDNAGRRKNARREDGSKWDYQYNDRSEVTGAAKSSLANNAIPGLTFAYAYDGIGNRTSSSSGTGTGINSRSYTPDALNQYDAITTQGKFSILTRSSSLVTATATNATVGNPVQQEGNFYGVDLTASSGADGKFVTTTVKRNNVAAGTVGTWVPPANLVPVYDADGNLTNDGRWVYTWDGENRLISMVPTPTAKTAGVPNVTVKFAYDWLGRRIGKSTATTVGTSTTTVYVSYAYDGWNVIAEWSRANLSTALSLSNTKRTYLWGPDQKSSGFAPAGTGQNLQAGGGIGGLLASTYYTTVNNNTSKEYFIPSYDANGNIIGWTNGTGSLIQLQDYDPFGNPVQVEQLVSASVSKLPAFGFSTKLRDAETSLCYYGYRYYDPVTGRWLSRDPIAENGGINIYGFIGNSAISRSDYLGLDSFDDIWNEGGKIFDHIVDATQGDYDGIVTDANYAVGQANAAYAATLEALGPDAQWLANKIEQKLSKPESMAVAKLVASLVPFDAEGKEIFFHWMEGTGTKITHVDGSWGVYMKNNEKLRGQLKKNLTDRDALVRSSSGKVNLKLHGVMEDGYESGYQLLHGSSGDDVTIKGSATFSRSHGVNTIEYKNLEYTWNDRIDPNAKYKLDTKASNLLHSVASPADYDIKLVWHADSGVCVKNKKIIRQHGYPFDKYDGK